MKIRTLNCTAVLLTLAGLLAAYLILPGPLGGSFINPSRATYTQHIHDRISVMLIQPEWIRGEDFDILINWLVAETQARWAIVFVLWLVSMLTLNYFIRKEKRKSNQQLNCIENSAEFSNS